MLVTTPDCKLVHAHGNKCPDENRNGFIFNNTEFSMDWNHLDQTKVLIFHSWIAEYAKVGHIVQGSDGRDKLMFQTPLKHAPIGQYAAGESIM